MVTEKTRLNLGCRTRTMDGFKNMDIDPHPGVDIVGDISDLSEFQDGSIAEIYASHVLEHFPHVKTAEVIAEWARVLESGGRLYVAVPDFERAVQLYGLVGLNAWVENFLMGDQGYKTAFHYAIFDEAKLTAMLKAAGFSDVIRVDQFPIGDEGDCSNLASNLDGLPVSLNLIAVK